MGLEQKLQLKLSQKLIMTPSLQQAIKLLQMTKLELSEVVAQELVENPLLEELTEDAVAEDAKRDAPELESVANENQTDGGQPNAETADAKDAEPLGAEKERDSFEEIDYDAFFQDYLEYGYNPRMREEYEQYPMENLLTRPPDLADHLTWQLRMCDAGPVIKEIGSFLIGNLDEDGYLRVTPEEISSAFPDVAQAEIDRTIQLVQSFDPLGVCARTLQECLLIQLDHLDVEYDRLDEVEAIIENHWDLFSTRKFQQLSKTLGIDMKELEVMVEIIRHLDPKPGRRYDNERTIYVEPDVHVYKIGDEYVINLNEDGLPRLRLNGRYRQMLQKKDASDGETVNYIKDKMRSAVWLIKSLDQRQRTIYKVAESIVRHQRDFLDHGIDRLRPMVLRDVADDIQMHESTVSRVVTNKYIHTPRGLFLMKFFFHSGLDSRDGEDVSSLAVKRRIQQFVAEEDPKKPLSDSKIVKLLSQEGVTIARRTVAKYRDELGIASSTDRKRVF
jgi:RNA polymerase sigma-54 factor